MRIQIVQEHRDKETLLNYGRPITYLKFNTTQFYSWINRIWWELTAINCSLSNLTMLFPLQKLLSVELNRKIVINVKDLQEGCAGGPLQGSSTSIGFSWENHEKVGQGTSTRSMFGSVISRIQVQNRHTELLERMIAICRCVRITNSSETDSINITQRLSSYDWRWQWGN
jgi:hypothetical protein